MNDSIEKITNNQSDILLRYTTVNVYTLASDPLSIGQYMPCSIAMIDTEHVDLTAFDHAIMSKSTFDALSTACKKRLPNDVSIITDTSIEQPNNGWKRRKIYSAIERIFGNPRDYCDLFIDCLELTIDVSVKQMKRITNLMNQWMEEASYVDTPFVEDEWANHYKKMYVIRDFDDSCISLLHDPCRPGERDKTKREKGNYVRLLKLTFNPKKVNQQHLDTLLEIISKACRKRFTKIMRASVITRYDITTDIQGFHVSDFIYRKKGCQYSKRYIGADGRFQTIIEGADGTCRANAYDKLLEMSGKATERGDFEEVERLSKMKPITRFEITYRPYKLKSITGTTLGRVWNFCSPFECIELYNGDDFASIPELEPWLEYIEKYGLNSLRKKLVKKEWKKLKVSLKSAEIEINHDELELLQHRLLRKIAKYLYTAGHAPFFS